MSESLVRIRTDITFYAAVIEDPETGERWRTPWCTDRYWTDKNVLTARMRRQVPRLILRARAKKQQELKP